MYKATKPCYVAELPADIVKNLNLCVKLRRSEKKC